MREERGSPTERDLGAHPKVHTEEGGVTGEAIKRWGIEGIRKRTSGRFGLGILYMGGCQNYGPVLGP